MNTAREWRIAKNTLFLYARMLVGLAVSLYTARVVLEALGAEDYGLYNVVGGVVAVSSILSGMLSEAIGRFLTLSIGRGDAAHTRDIFSSSVTMQLLLSLVVVALVETVGVWFLNTQMEIPHDRMQAANYVLQLSLLAGVVGLVCVPYNACIVAHERMSAIACIGLFEIVAKLVVALLIRVSPFDRLVWYVTLMVVLSLVMRGVYGVYCKRHFAECTFRLSWNAPLLKEMIGFAGWNFVGYSAVVLKDQGVNIVINMFCGTAINAARAIAMQVNTAVNGFVGNFLTALNPQITKSYASGDRGYMDRLIFAGTRFSYYILLCLSLPVLLHTERLLQIWLHAVPPLAVDFTRLALILSLCDVLYRPLLTAHLATGRIRLLQIVVGGMNLLVLPLSYLALRMGYQPTSTLYICILFSIAGLFVRLHLFKRVEGLRPSAFVRHVIGRVVVVTCVGTACAWLSAQCFGETASAGMTVLSCVCSFFVTLPVCAGLGLSGRERNYIIHELKNKLRRC